MDSNENNNGQRCVPRDGRQSVWKNRAHLLQLPDEILLLIFKALPMGDLLSSLSDVHPRLHGLAHTAVDKSSIGEKNDPFNGKNAKNDNHTKNANYQL